MKMLMAHYVQTGSAGMLSYFGPHDVILLGDANKRFPSGSMSIVMHYLLLVIY